MMKSHMKLHVFSRIKARAIRGHVEPNKDQILTLISRIALAI